MDPTDTLCHSFLPVQMKRRMEPRRLNEADVSEEDRERVPMVGEKEIQTSE